ncbi:MAG: nitronate monooxygenase [Gammaproteobacteria bacterium]|nr:nitronate monooxygenase [Gammaproteobacteria bacterium]MCY4228487.1 nitronate monooxygenase [Gammaproteobacteria bacterium]MCY4312460.1 nitronate monooxygenase [Gammaproteobacteria bacterium]
MCPDILPLERSDQFCRDNNLGVPILLSPMAGACPPALSIAVSKAGGMGACGVLLMQPEAIEQWMQEFRSATSGPVMLNSWIPDPEPTSDPLHEAAVRSFLEQFGPKIPDGIERKQPPDFEGQCEAMLNNRPDVISSIMGLFNPSFVKRMKEAGIRWYATVTTVGEAIEATEAGADVVVAQGMEAGGHRGAFDAENASERMVGLTSLVPAVVDAVDVPVVAAGGIADGRGIAAALALGASAVQIGTGFLRCPEAGIPAAWADAIGTARPEDTIGTRAFSGRYGRSLRTSYAELASQPDSPDPAPYPIQRALTQPMRDDANRTGDIDRMQAWAGQSAGLAQATTPAGLIAETWSEAQRVLRR